jgi:enoyl-CoA hydratase/carnithine racemase
MPARRNEELQLSRYDRYTELDIEVADGIAAVKLNRPKSRNAINSRMFEELRELWDDLSEDKDVNAILITGAGDYFSVGGDVKAMAERHFGDVLEEGEMHDPAMARRIITRLLDIDKPTIAAINGDAVGLAATLALLCDITVAAETARIGDTHVNRVGLVAGDGAAIIWPLLVGVSRAKEYLMRGTLINGIEAERIGLVNHVVPKDEVLAYARGIAEELAHGPSWAIRWTKLSVNQVLKQRLNLILEASWALEMVSADLADHTEATKAFAERRQPRFTGR